MSAALEKKLIEANATCIPSEFLARLEILHQDLVDIERLLVGPIRVIVELLELERKEWATERANAHKRFVEHWIPKLSTSKAIRKDFPRWVMRLLIEDLDLFLFNGQLSNKVDFEWHGPSDGLLGDCGVGSNRTRRLIRLYAGCRQSGDIMIGTLLHGMCHAFVQVRFVHAFGETWGIRTIDPWTTAIGKPQHGYCWQMLAVAMEVHSQLPIIGYEFDIITPGYSDGDFEGHLTDRLCCLHWEDTLKKAEREFYEDAWSRIHFCQQLRVDDWQAGRQNASRI
jgi:hypothetical protein